MKSNTQRPTLGMVLLDDGNGKSRYIDVTGVSKISIQDSGIYK